MKSHDDCYLGRIYFKTTLTGIHKVHAVSFSYVFPCSIRKEDFVKNDGSARFSDDFLELFEKQWNKINIWNAPINIELISAEPCNLESAWTSDDQEARATGVLFGILGYLDGYGVPGASFGDVCSRFNENTRKEIVDNADK